MRHPARAEQPRCRCCGRYVHCECERTAARYEPDLFRAARIEARVRELFPRGSMHGEQKEGTAEK